MTILRAAVIGALLSATVSSFSCRVGDPIDLEALQGQLSISESFGTGSSSDVESGWIAGFGDEKLVALVQEALEKNPDLQVVAAQVESAAGYARQAGALLQPAVNLGAGGLAGGGGPVTSRRGASLDLSWELDVWGRLRSQASSAENQYVAAELTYAYGRQSLAAQVAKSWFLCVETRLQRRAAEDAVAVYEKTLEIVQGQFRLEAVTKRDVQLAEADLASSNEALRQATGGEKQARRALEVLLGRYPSAELEATEEFAALSANVPAGLPCEILERRADLVAAERRVAAAFENVRVARAARLPRVAITASAGGSTTEFADLANPSNAFWTLGANMLAPLFDGGFLKAEEDIATAEQKAAVAQYRKAALQAFADIENGLENDGLLKERESFLNEALTKNTAAWDLSKRQFEAGAIDLLSVLQLQKRVLNARVALINIRARRRAERANLHLSLGGNFETTDK